MIKLLLKQLINFTLIYTGHLHLFLWRWYPLFRGFIYFMFLSYDVEYKQLDNVCVTMATSPFIAVD